MKETPFGNVLGVVVARYDSKTMEKKPVKEIGGKPLVRIAWETAMKANYLSKVVLSTDGKEVELIGTTLGAEVMMTPRDIRTGIDRAAAVWNTLRDEEYNIIVSIPCDLPFLPYEVIDRCVAGLANASEEIGVASVAIPIYDEAEFLSPKTVKTVVSVRDELVWFSRSPSPYSAPGQQPKHVDVKGQTHTLYGFRHIPIYAFRVAPLFDFADTETSPLEELEQLEQLRLIEMNIRIAAVVVSPELYPDHVDVDSDDDYIKAVDIERRKSMI